jgi:hypothetical protein
VQEFQIGNIPRRMAAFQRADVQRVQPASDSDDQSTRVWNGEAVVAGYGLLVMALGLKLSDTWLVWSKIRLSLPIWKPIVTASQNFLLLSLIECSMA